MIFVKNNIIIFLPIFLIAIAELLIFSFDINPFIIILLVSISTIMSIYFLLIKLIEYTKYFKSKVAIALFSLSTLIITYMSNVYVNNYIVEFTDVKPSLFPLAQQMLFPFVGLILWTIYSYFLLLITLIAFPIKTIYDEYKKKNKNIKFMGKYIQIKHQHIDNQWAINISVVFGLSMLLTVIHPSFMKFLFSDYYKNNVLKKVFIFSSYYQNYEQHICKNLDENVFIAFLNKNNISYIKIADSNSTFLHDICVTKSNNTLKRNKLP